jgi:hypothetical protein
VRGLIAEHGPVLGVELSPDSQAAGRWALTSGCEYLAAGVGTGILGFRADFPDIAAGLVWPGAMTRSRRNRFIERWAGREWALRQCRADAIVRLRAARESGDVDEGPLSMGQDAGLIHDIPQAADIVSRIALEAEEILTRKLPRLLAGAT